MKAFVAFIKPYEAPPSVKVKNLNLLCPGLGQEGSTSVTQFQF